MMHKETIRVHNVDGSAIDITKRSRTRTDIWGNTHTDVYVDKVHKTKEQLENLQIGQKALKQIMIPYDNYNKCVLYNKTKNYIVKQKDYKKAQKESSDLMQKIRTSKR